MNRSILDDLMHYEERERVTQVEKSRLLRKTYNSSLFVPAFVPTNIVNGSVNQPPPAHDIQQDDIVARFKKVDEKSVENEFPKNDEIHRNCTVSWPFNVDGEQPNGIVKQHLKVDGKDDKQPNLIADKLPELNGKQLLDVADQHLEAHEEQQNGTVGSPKADGRQMDYTVTRPLIDKKQPNSSDDRPLKGDGRQLNYSIHPSKANGKQFDGTAVKASKANGKQANSTVPQTPKAGGKRFNGMVHHSANIVESPSKHCRKQGHHSSN